MKRSAGDILPTCLIRGLAAVGAVILSSCLNDNQSFPYVSLGGSVLGLHGSGLVLQNNGGNDLAIHANGGFTFESAVLRGSRFNITVSAHPVNPAQRCSVVNGAGTAGGRVDNVLVNCVDTHTVGGVVEGLRGSGLTLRNNGGDDLRINGNGEFAFNTVVAAGENYSVSVQTQPGGPAQTCSITNAAGVVTTVDIVNVQVSCVTNTYLFFKNPLNAVDPSSPTVPIEIESAGSTANVTAIEHATYRPAPLYDMIDRHYESIVYRRTASGTFWKVSAVSDNTLTPTQVSNASGVTSICQVRPEPDYADHDDAQLVYRLPGTDNTCGNADDTWKMIKVGMSASDAPYSAFQPVAAVRDAETGAITGWLAINGGNLNAYDVNFTSPVLVSAFSVTPSVVATSAAGRIVLHIDNELRIYDPHATPPTLSGALATVTAIGTVRRDVTHLYYDDGASLYKMPLDGSSSASLVVTGSGYVSLASATANYLVYWDDSSLKSVSKSGGVPVTLASGGGAAIESIGAAGTRYYFHVYWFCGTGWCATAHIVDEDGANDTAIDDAAWFAWTEPNSVSYGAGKGDVGLDRVLQRNVLTAPFTVKSYAAASGNVVATLGTMPATMDQGYSPFFMRLANHNNLLGYSLDSANGTYDVVFANTDTADSLVRVTDSNANETMVGASGCSINRRTEMDPTFYLILLAAFAWVVCRRRYRGA